MLAPRALFAAGPTITTPPASITVTQGGSASFSVVATGNGSLTYEWRRNGLAISGATGNSHSIPAVTAGDAGTYTVRVTDADGTVESTAATLSVDIPVDIQTHPTGASISAGGSHSMSVIASGTGPFSYKWAKNSIDIAGATGPTYTVTNAQATDAGSYEVTVSNVLSGQTYTKKSNPAVLAVVIPPVITIEPSAGQVAVGSALTMSVTATGTAPLTYQWKKDGTNVPGGTSASLSFSSAAVSHSGTYTVVVANSAGTATSAPAALSVEMPPSILTQPAGAVVRVNTGTTFTVTASGTAPLAYQWKKNGTDIAGANSGSLALSSLATTDSGTYTVVVSNAVGSATSSQAQLSVEIPPSIVTEPTGTNILVNSGTTFAVTVAGTPPFTYQWKKNGIDIAGANSGSLALSSLATGDSGTYTVAVSNAVGTVSSQDALLSVLSPVTITAQPQSQVVQVGGTVTFAATVSGSTPINYQWLKDSTPIAGATNATYTLTNAVVASAGSFSVVVSNSVSTETSNPARLSVAPRITTPPPDGVATVGVPFTFSVTAEGGGALSYQWRNNLNVDIAGATSPTYTLASPTLKDAGYYSVRVSNEAGLAFETSVSARLTVAESPVLTGIIMNPPSGAAVETTAIKNSFASFTADIAWPYPKISDGPYATAVDSPISYQWFFNGQPVLSGGSSKVLQIPSVTAANGGSYSVVATSVTGTLTAGPVLFTTLKPVSIVTHPQSATVNVGSLFSLSVDVAGTQPMTFQWYDSKMDPIAGATSGTLTFPSIKLSDQGEYTVFVQNSYQGATISSIYSNSAKITVNPPPVMTRQPEAAFAVVGGNASFSAAAMDDPVTGPQTAKSYQWRKNGSTISGATSPTYILSGVQPSDAGSYSCVISTLKGNVTSDSVPLTIFQPVSITTQLQGGTVALGDAHTFNVNATGPAPLTYQWRKEGTPLSNSTYTFKPGLFSWHQAKADAEANGGHLATVSNAAEWTALVSQLSAAGHAGKTAWLGGYQPDGSAEPKDGWTWLGGEAVSFTKWRSGKPDDKTAGVYSQQYMQATISAAGDWEDSENAPATIGGYVLEIESNSPSYTVTASTAAAAGNYDVVVSSPGGQVTSQSVTLTVLEPPTFLTHPASTFLLVGSPLTLTTKVAGTPPFSYQWLKDSAPISGQVTDSLSRPAVSFADAGTYAVKVTNVVDSLNSSNANVIVYGPISVTTQPVSSTVNPGAPVSFTVGASFQVQPASAAVLTYKWMKNGVAVTDGTSAVLSIPSAAALHAGTYTCQVFNSALLGTAVTSDPAVLSVNTPPYVITNLPASKVLLAGSTLSLTANFGGTEPLTYQWRKNGVPISGQTAKTFSLPNVQSSDEASYSVEVNNITGTAATSSATALTVVNPVVITTQPVATTVPMGGLLRLTVATTGTQPITYQWYKDGAAIPLATADNYFVPYANPVDAGRYHVTARNEASSVTSVAVDVVVQTPVVITTQPSSGTVALGGSYTLSVAASGSSPFTYQWLKNGSLIAGATNATHSITGALSSDGAQYTVTVSNVISSTDSTPATVTVLTPLTITTQPADQTLTAGMDAILQVVASGASPVTYQWRKNGVNIANATAANIAVLSAQTVDSGSYEVVVSNPVGSVTSSPATLKVCDPISITSEPAGASVAAGSPFTVSVAVSGTGPLTYQWRKNGTNIPTATAAFLTLPTSQLSDAGDYDVVVSGPVNSVTSLKGVLTVLEPVSITTHPASVALNVGGAHTLGVTASGTTPLTYQWRKDGTAIPGATGSTYPFVSAQFSDSGSYDVLVSNAAGSAQSNAATVTVSTPPVIINQPVGGNVGIGGTLGISVTATGTAPLAYQWRKAGVNITGGTASTYMLYGAQTADSGTYDVVVSNAAGTVTSIQASVAVSDPIVITTQPAPRTIAVGASASFSVSATGTGPLVYQWKKDGAVIPSAQAASFVVTNAVSTDSGSYTVAVSNATQSVESSAAELSVLSPPAISIQPTGASVALGSGQTLSVTATGSPPLTYQWRRGGTPISGATGANFSLAAAQLTDAGTYDVVVSNPIGTTTSLGAVLNVLNGVTFTVHPSNVSVAAGSLASFSASVSGDTPITFQWLKNGTPLPGATGTSLVIPIAQSGDEGFYTVLAANAVSSTTSNAGTLTVIGAPVIVTDPSGGTVLKGASRTLSASATGTLPLSYQWFLGSSPIPGATATTYTIASATLSDEGDYSVLVSNNSGSATSAKANVVVVEGPQITTQPPANTTEITTATVQLTVVASGKAPLTYQWRKNGLPITGATAATYQILSAVASDTGSFDVQVSNSGGTVTSTAAQLTIITPIKITKHPSHGNVLVGGTQNLTVEATGTQPITYQWRKGGVAIPGATGPSYQITNANTGAAGSYDVVLTNAAGSVTSKTAYISVGPGGGAGGGGSPVEITKQPDAVAAIAVGGTFSFSVEASGTPTITYQWKLNGVDISGGTAATISSGTAKLTDAGTYTVLVQNDYGFELSEPVVLKVLEPVAITTQPVNTAVRLGSTATLSVAATGAAPIFYQWRKEGVDIPGATAASYVINFAQTADSGTYDVVASNAVSTITSGPAVLSVDESVTITLQPLPASVVLGGTASFTVTATGAGPLTYQWRKNGSPIPGAAAPILDLPNAQDADSADYSVVVANNVSSATSTNAALVVYTPVAITTHPQSSTVNEGANATLSVAATGSPALTYQWAKDGVDIAGATSATYTVAPATMLAQGSYQVVVSNPAGSTTSNVATLSVRNAPQVLTHPASASVLLNSGTSLSVTASGHAPLSYQWRKGGTAISGATAPTLAFASAGASDSGEYDVVVSNVAGTATSQTATITVLTPPSILSHPSSATVVLGKGGTLAVSVSGSEPITYQWRKDGSPIAGATGNVFALTSVQTTDAGSYSVVATNPAGSVVSNPATLTVQSPVVLLTQPLSLGVIPGTNATFSVTATGSSPITYQWRKDGTPIAGATNASYTVSNAQSANGGAYDVVLNNPVGSVTSQSATLTVFTAPAVTTDPSNQTVTAGNTATFQVAASGSAPLGYQWRKAGVNIPGATGSSLVIANAQASDEALYSVVITNAAGSATSTSATLTVQNRPVILTPPASLSVKAGQPASMSVTASGTAPLTYQWRKAGANITGATSSTFSIPAAAETDAGNYDVTVTNAAGSVTSIEAALSVRPSITITTQPVSGSVRQGDTYSLSVAVSGASPLTYQWFKDGTPIPGATAETHMIFNAVPGDVGDYSVTVSNPSGTATSAIAHIEVTQPVVIVTQPVGGVAIRNASFTFNVGVTGSAPLSYQWMKDGVPVVGGTNAALSLSSAQFANTGTYSVTVSNTINAATSHPVPLTVVDAVEITSQPLGATVVEGARCLLSVAASGTGPLIYQWRKDGVDIEGATADSYLFPEISAAEAGGYDVLVGNLAGTVQSQIATVFVVQAPTIIKQPVGGLVMEGGTFTFNVLATGSLPLNYQWLKGGSLITSGSINASISLLGGQTGTTGSADGTLANARFSSPTGLALDLSGNLYASDSASHTIRKISPSGVVSTFAGSPGVAGSSDGAGSGARFSSPEGLAVDAYGNVYVADSGNHVIRKITPAGQTTTFVGTAGSLGFANGTGAAARFNAPAAIGIDDFGNVYVGDNNHVIRKISPAGVVSTFAGSAGNSGTADGLGQAARFNAPRSLLVDGTGNVFVADSGNHAIRKITAGGLVSTFAGVAGTAGTNDGTGAAARFNTPRGITMDEAGNLFVSDSGSHTLRRITPARSVSTVSGQAGSAGSLDGNGTSALLNAPLGITTDGGSLFYVADSGNRTLRKLFFDGSVTGTLDALTISNAKPTDSDDYTVRISNTAGTATSNLASLEVLAGVKITTQPKGGGVIIGGNILLSVSATGAEPITYQWVKDGVELPGQTGSSLNLTNFTTASYGDYSVRVANQVSQETSTAATVFFVTAPSIIVPPVGGIAGLNETFAMNVVADGTGPLSYEWYRSGTLVSNKASSPLSLAPVQFSDEGNYVVTVRSIYGTASSPPVNVKVVDFSLPLQIPVPDGNNVVYTGTLGYRGGVEIWRDGSGAVDFQVPMDVPKQITYFSTATSPFTIDQSISASTTGIVQRSDTSELVLAKSTLTVNPSGTSLVSEGAAPFTIQSRVQGSGTLSVEANTSGSVTLSGLVDPSGLFENHGVGSGLVTVAGTLGGSVTGVVQNSWSSFLQLESANAYGGPTVVEAGSLVVRANGALGNTAGGTSVEKDAVLDLRNVNYTLPESLAVHGGTVLVSDGISTFGGGIQITGGTTFFDIEGASLTVEGPLSGDDAFVKTGPGKLIFKGPGTSTGQVTIREGTLAGAGPASLGSGMVFINSGATLELGGGTDTADTATYPNTIKGAGTLVKTGPNTVVLTGDNKFSGGTVINEGSLMLSGTATIGIATVTVADNALLVFNPTGDTVLPNSIYGPVASANMLYKVVWGGGPGTPGGGAIGGPKSELIGSSDIYGFVGDALDRQVVASHDPSKFEIKGLPPNLEKGLPPGLVLSGTTGMVTGTPEKAGISTAILTLTNPGGVSTFNINFIIRTAEVKNFVVTKDPASLAIPLGGAGRFSALIFSDKPFTYQWKKNGDPVGPVYSSPGGVEPVEVSLPISKVGSAAEGLFTVAAVRINGARKEYCESNPAMLTVLQPTPRFGTASLLRQGRYFDLSKASQSVPVDLKTVAENDYFVVKVAVDPTAKYNWYYSSFKTTNWTLLPGQTWPILSFSDPLIPKETGGFLRMAVSTPSGMQTLMFRVETFSGPLDGFKIPVPDLFIVSHPYPVMLKKAGEAYFSVIATGYPVWYTWYRKDLDTGLTSFVDAGRIPYLRLPAENAIPAEYYVVVTDYWGKTMESLKATLEIDPD